VPQSSFSYFSGNCLKKSFFVTAIASSLFWTGCAEVADNLWVKESAENGYADNSSEQMASTDSSSSGSPSEVTTTGISTVAGAVIGGGLGTIIGSTSGHAGEGLAVGLAAGAATGAAVGYQLEKQNEATSEQREVLTKQRETIHYQGQEIKKLRDDLEDRFPNNRPSSLSRNVPLASYKGSSRAKVWGKDVARARLASSPTASESRETIKFAKHTATEMPAATRAASTKPMVKRVPVVQAKKAVVETTKATLPVAAKQADPVTTEVATVVAKKEEIQKQVTKTTIEAKNIPAVSANTAVATIEPATAVAKQRGLADTPADCTQARDEAQRGDTSVSEADKLFYYTRASRLCPSNAEFRVNIGQVYASLGKKKEAAQEFRRALEVDPNNEVANEELSLIEADVAKP